MSGFACYALNDTPGCATANDVGRSIGLFDLEAGFDHVEGVDDKRRYYSSAEASSRFDEGW